jgi:uncharacterized membrane protein/ribosomal protein L37E
MGNSVAQFHCFVGEGETAMAVNCQRCGAVIAQGSVTCSSCGATLNAKASPSNVVAAISYVGFAVTGVIFLLLDPYRNDELVRFHARQSIAFTVAWIAFSIIMSVFVGVMPGFISRIFMIIEDVGHIAFALMWVYLIYQAYIGNRFRVPILGDWADAVPL